MIEESKINSIKEYLKQKFPENHHADKNDFDRHGHKFRITTQDKVLLLSVAESFIGDNDIQVIISFLDEADIAKVLIDNHDSTVIVTGQGIKLEPRN